ncbi:hypothetical protein DFP72DRAFT_427271 [Ephemerocybe angulata]|uniref:Nephrocystin 3-like N-terminal domain-containing protein n=1 Tax=Ephemerocybe angulata TaxID=980116 RepID=A0A8H6HVA6_9AGAR|nr:hypothetical protein DFP72DRAFT_427271 [Tulosesus angulatus]
MRVYSMPALNFTDSVVTCDDKLVRLCGRQKVWRARFPPLFQTYYIYAWAFFEPFSVVYTMGPDLQVARDRMDVDRGGPQFFSGASHISARDITVQNAGRDMIIVNPAPISGPEASIEEVTEWLNGANFRSVYRLSLEARMDNTGTWFIATFEFGEFVRQKGTVVWATGLPGSGKTILASISVEHLEEKFSGRADIAILYAFLRYSEKPNLLQIIAGLLTQLVRGHRVAFSHLLSTYLRARIHQDELSCSDAAKLLKGSLNLFSDAFIIIDGLDEVDDPTKDGLLDLLTSLDAHILLTCRPLELFMRRHTPSALHIPVQAQTRDIRVYVTKRVTQSTRLFSILSEHPDIAEKFTALIQEKSKGMFLLARLQMELVLERCTTIGSLLKALETLPSGINEMYHLTMARINSLTEEEVSIAHRAFIWILHAMGDLSPEALQHAPTFSYEGKEFVEDSSVSIPVLLSICCGLVTVEKRPPPWAWNDTKVIRFIHYSTQEFMRGLAFSHLPAPHDLLAVTSVACVETHLEMLKAALKSAETTSTDIVTRHLPLLRYALHNWGHHAKICDDQWSLSPSIRSFLSRHGTYALVNSGHDRLSEVSTGLHLAAAYDLVNLISSRTFPYYPTHGTKTPFHVAAKYGHTAALRALLENYSGVHVKDEVGRTPLHHCVLRDSTWEPEVVRQLLNLSSSDTWRAFPTEVFDINAQDHYGGTAFFAACSSSADDIDFLNASTEPEGPILQLFNSHPGIDVDLPDSNGNTPFAMTCSHSAPVAQFLISSVQTLKLDTRNKWGETPFMHACDSFLETLVNWFLSRDPGGCHFPHQEDEEGLTALERILAYEGFETVRNREGRSYLRDWQRDSGLRRTGCLGDLAEMIRILLGYASYVRVVRTGHSEGLPIYQVQTSRTQQYPTIHVCLEDGHRRYEDQRTSLMLLANYPAALKHLVSENENNPHVINAQDTDGRCALMYACFGRQDPGDASARLSVKLLTSCPSIDIHLRDRDGMSALDYALYSNNIDARDVLLAHPSWDAPGIRNAVISTAQELKIRSEALRNLLRIQQIQDAFCSNTDNIKEGRTLLKEALLRRADCRDMVEEDAEGGVFRCPSRGLFRTISVEPPHPSGFVRWLSTN